MGSMNHNANKTVGRRFFLPSPTPKLGTGRRSSKRLPVTFEECQRYDRAVGDRLARSLMEKFGSHERLPELLEFVDSYQPPSWLCAVGRGV